MDKINTQKFNLSIKKSVSSKADDALGALFSMPVIVDEKKVNEKQINELIVNPSIEKILSSKKSSKKSGRLEIMYKEFFSKIPKNQSNNPIFKNAQVFDFNSRKIPNVFNIDVKSDKLLKINNIKKNEGPKSINFDITKDLDIEINSIKENEITHLKASNKSNLTLSSNNNLIKKK